MFASVSRHTRCDGSALRLCMSLNVCLSSVLAATFAAMVMNTSRSNVVFLQKWEEVQSYMVSDAWFALDVTVNDRVFVCGV